MKKLTIFWGVLLLLFAGLKLSGLLRAEAKAKYVGIDKCKTCHEEHYKDYHGRRFDRAFKVLKMRKLDKNPECLKCHTTGFGEESGFVSEEKTPHLANKQCEACHGPGSLHVAEPANPKVTKPMKDYVHRAEVCIRCHICMKSHRVIKF